VRFLELTLGDGQLEFPSVNSVQVPFTFPAPVHAVRPLISGFSFERVGGDMELNTLSVSLTPLFNSGESTTTGNILVEFRFTGGAFEIIPESHPVRAVVKMLLVGS
jgi:hypothetical protein